MKNHSAKARGIVLDLRHRTAGSAEINGKLVEWKEGDILHFIPLENTKGTVFKYTLDPENANQIYQLLDDVCWGCLVELVFKEKLVTDVLILSDWLANCYATDDLLD